MATERLIIQVSTSGTRVVQRNLKSIGRSAKESQTGVVGLGRALTLLGGLALARSILKTADSFQQLQNRLRIVTRGTGQLAAVTRELFDISNRTRTSVAANAELFTRLSLATRELGLSQRELLDVTESINQALIVSGASAQEANAGLIQLSQGLASGVLRGDELRSVLEQLPAVADVIAKELKVARGELRALGAQGVITAKVITSAFRNNREELQELFERTIPTLAQSFTILQNKIVELVGEIEKTSGPLADMSKAILFLANNIETFARVVLGAVLVVAIDKAIKALALLRVAFLANPVGILLTALALAVGLLVTFADKIKLSSDGAITLGNAVEEAGKTLSAVFKEGAKAIGELLEQFGLVNEGISDVNFSFETLIRAVGVTFDILGQIVKTTFASILVIFDGFPAALGDVFFQGVKIAAGAIAQLLVSSAKALKNLVDASLKAIDTLATGAKGFIAALVGISPAAQVAIDAIATGIKALGKEAGDTLDGLADTIVVGVGEIGNKFTGEAAALKDTILILFKDVLVKDLDKGLSKVIDDAFARIRAGERGREEERTLALGGDAVEDLGVFERIAKSFRDIKLGVEAVAKSVSKTLVTALDSASEAFADFALSGFQNIDNLQAAFSKLFAQIAQDILKLLIRQAILRTAFGIAGAFAGPGAAAAPAGAAAPAAAAAPNPFATGGRAATLFGGRLQAGGPVRGNRPVVVGEQGPELFVPPSGGNIVPAGQFGQPEVNVTIVNVDDPNAVTAAVESAEGQQAVLNVIQKNRTQLKNLLA